MPKFIKHLTCLTAVIGIGSCGGQTTVSEFNHPQPGQSKQLGVQPYNVIVIISDDQRADAISCMPNLQHHLVKQSLSFSRYYASTSLCCPSRSSYFTGQFAHNHGVKSNGDIEDDDPADGVANGAELFRRNGHETNGIAKMMQSAGYTTAYFGKYINGYSALVQQDNNRDGKPDNYVPPYWHEWAAMLSGQSMFYFKLFERALGQTEGTRVCYLSAGVDPALGKKGCLNSAQRVVDDGKPHHMDELLGEKLIAFVEKMAQKKAGPFFAVYAPKSPHAPMQAPLIYQPDPTQATYTAAATQKLSTCALFDWNQRPASFKEADVSDKPEWISRVKAKTATFDYETPRHKQLVSALGIDDVIARLFDRLKQQQLLDKTIIIYTSDNGYSWGEHYWHKKNCAYEECNRLPFVIYHPKSARKGQKESTLAMNVDLLPTIAKLTGASIPAGLAVDGQDLSPLMTSANAIWPRTDILHECWGGVGRAATNHFSAVQTKRWKYIEHYSDIEQTTVLLRSDDNSAERELYDLKKDPYELDNLLRLSNADLATRGYQPAYILTLSKLLSLRLNTLKSQ